MILSLGPNICSPLLGRVKGVSGLDAQVAIIPNTPEIVMYGILNDSLDVVVLHPSGLP